MLGAVAVLVPRFPRLKEWAYADMFYHDRSSRLPPGGG
jgi:hypothetical protein